MNKEEQKKVLEKEKKKINISLLISTIIVIILGLFNYLMVSLFLGIFLFVFLGSLRYSNSKGRFISPKAEKESIKFNKKEKEKSEINELILKATGMNKEEFMDSQKKKRKEDGEKKLIEEQKEMKKLASLTELKKFKEQLDLEILTQEEYDQHKERLGKIIKG